jgi:hypothetical protein
MRMVPNKVHAQHDPLLLSQRQVCKQGKCAPYLFNSCTRFDSTIERLKRGKRDCYLLVTFYLVRLFLAFFIEPPVSAYLFSTFLRSLRRRPTF